MMIRDRRDTLLSRVPFNVYGLEDMTMDRGKPAPAGKNKGGGNDAKVHYSR